MTSGVMERLPRSLRFYSSRLVSNIALSRIMTYISSLARPPGTVGLKEVERKKVFVRSIVTRGCTDFS